MENQDHISSVSSTTMAVIYTQGYQCTIILVPNWHPFRTMNIWSACNAWFGADTAYLLRLWSFHSIASELPKLSPSLLSCEYCGNPSFHDSLLNFISHISTNPNTMIAYLVSWWRWACPRISFSPDDFQSASLHRSWPSQAPNILVLFK